MTAPAALQAALSELLGDAQLSAQTLPGTEIKLWLIDPANMDRCFSPEETRLILEEPPYWCFCWASGLVLARWLVEHGYDVETEVGRRKTADLRGVEVPTRAPAARPAPARRRSQERWAIPLLVLAAVCGVLGVIATFVAPALSLVPWVLAVGAGVVGGYLWGREGHALLPRRRR